MSGQNGLIIVGEAACQELVGRAEAFTAVEGAFAAMAKMQPTDEQGFEGFRIDSPFLEGGIVVGRDKLVFAMVQGRKCQNT